MSRAVFGGAGELHRFLAAVRAISAVIVVVAVPIRVPIMIPICVPSASTMISVVISVAVVAIVVAVAALGNLRSIHHEVCTASTIHPNSLLIESPSLTLSTGRLTALSL